MDTCDALIVGGGPAGSSCAWRLVRAGLDVIVMDRSAFPRDKVCAGWITPQVVHDLQLDVEDYRRGRTFQAITGFRTGVIDEPRALDTSYGRAVSFGIRRCEFDDYLLRRSRARLALGEPLADIRRHRGGWIVNDRVRAAVLVGAGGHFCPVARWLDGAANSGSASIVVAQEVEFAPGPPDADAFATSPEVPELYFCRDLNGYGWCVRKERYYNIGFGRLDRHSLPRATAAFVDYLKRIRRIPDGASFRWRGHAYGINAPSRRRLAGAGVLVAGDAAGLAYAQSGEGIRPAVESGLLAADTIVEAGGCYSRDRLAPYERRLRARLAAGSSARRALDMAPPGLTSWLALKLMAAPPFVRHVVLDRWFLHAGEPPLQRGPADIV